MIDLKTYQIGEIIDPAVVAKELGITPFEVCKRVNPYFQEGLVELNYRPYCPECEKHGEFYTTLNSLPYPLHCQCGKELNPFENTFVYYKVIKTIEVVLD